jgi:phospholipase D1/2
MVKKEIALQRAQYYFFPHKIQTNLARFETREIDEAKGYEELSQPKLVHDNLRDTSLQKWQEVAKDHAEAEDCNCTCQMLRSACKWSLGLASNQTECSIMNSYIELINKAENYIYMENQFFISSNASRKVKNPIVKCLIDKLKSKIKNHELFKVIICIPLIPGHTGDVQDKSGNLIRLFLSYENKTIGVGEKSIIETVKRSIKLYKPPRHEVSDYVQVFGFRTHDVMPDGEPRTEIIYIHSKLLLVDDKVALIGSANLNDRSMLGTRDTELAMVVNDNHMVKGKISYEERTTIIGVNFTIIPPKIFFPRQA